MTVAELIKKLSCRNPEEKVFVWDPYGDYLASDLDVIDHPEGCFISEEGSICPQQ